MTCGFDRSWSDLTSKVQVQIPRVCDFGYDVSDKGLVFHHGSWSARFFSTHSPYPNRDHLASLPFDSHCVFFSRPPHEKTLVFLQSSEDQPKRVKKTDHRSGKCFAGSAESDSKRPTKTLFSVSHSLSCWTCRSLGKEWPF